MNEQDPDVQNLQAVVAGEYSAAYVLPPSTLAAVNTLISTKTNTTAPAQ
jgi:hypothetical protein